MPNANPVIASPVDPDRGAPMTAVDKIAAGLREAIAVARGEEKPARLHDLASAFEAAVEAHRPFFYGAGTDEEAAASTARVDEIARKIVALPTADIEMMRLKARIYLWSEATDFKNFAAKNEGDGSSEAVLVSLFRDLGVADRPIGSITAPAPDPIFDLIEAHRKAWARIVDAHENLEGALSKEAFTFEIEARWSELGDTKNKLLKTPPATLVGARAIIEYLIEWDKENDPETSYEYLSTLLRSPIFAKAEARS
jgi:hypothetical protein